MFSAFVCVDVGMGSGLLHYGIPGLSTGGNNQLINAHLL
jgi:hypothetical protein